MHTNISFTVLKRFHEASISLKEHRLIYETPEDQEGQEDQEAGTEEQDQTCSRLQEEYNALALNSIQPELRNIPGLREAIQNNPSRPANSTLATTPAAPAAAPTPSRSPSSRPKRGIWKKHVWPVVKDLTIVGGATSATIGAASYATALEGTPILGPVSAAAKGLVASLSTGVGLASALSIPIGLGGLWTLGKIRVAHMKEYWNGQPDSEEKRKELSELEDVNMPGNMVEGLKLIAGTVQRAVRMIPVGIGKVTGFAQHMSEKFFKKLGGIKGIINWPFKNAKHIVKGGLVAGLSAAVATGFGLGPVGIPFSAAVGGILAFKKSRKGKAEATEATPAPASA